MKHLKFATFGFVATIVGISTLFSSTLFAESAEGDKSRLASLAKFTRVLATIEKYYVDDIKIDDIIKKSIEGMLAYGKPKEIHIAGIIASQEGLEYVRRMLPEAKIWVGALDEELTAKAYIVPGLGDAGDLAFGAKIQE